MAQNPQRQSASSTVDPAEVERFSALAAEWWNPRGKMAPLHKFNPVRLGFIRDEAARHFARDARVARPFAGLRLLDIGCGGGLLSGVSTAVKALSPATLLYGVEPAGYDDTLQSLRAGKRMPMTPTFRTLCDALETPCPGELTFPILQANVADVAVVTDAEVAEALRYAFGRLKLVVEPGGSAGLAALLGGKIAVKPGATGVL